MDGAWGALEDQPAVMQTSAVTVSPHGAAINYPAPRSILVLSSWGKESGPLSPARPTSNATDAELLSERHVRHTSKE